LLDVLEHLDAPADLLRQALRLLKDDGIVILTVPAFQSIWTRHDDLNHHRQRFTRRTLKPVTESAGMSWRSDRYLFQWAFIAKFFVRLFEGIWQGKPKPPSVPVRPINALLYGVTAVEETVGRALPLPFGSSLMVIGNKRSS
jgi:SAM-dependent methyltransferase